MDFDDEPFEVDADVPDSSDEPEFRATVQRSGAVRLVDWGPRLQSTGPAYTLMQDRDRAGIAIADLRVIRDDEGLPNEVTVEFHSGGSELHRAALRDWANAVGYTRVWFDDEVVDLEPAVGDPVTTRCTGCGQRYLDGRSRRFWVHVGCSGAFPTTCSLCGSNLEQWTPTRRADTSAAGLNVLAPAGLRDVGNRAHRRRLTIKKFLTIRVALLAAVAPAGRGSQWAGKPTPVPGR